MFIIIIFFQCIELDKFEPFDSEDDLMKTSLQYVEKQSLLAGLSIAFFSLRILQKNFYLVIKLHHMNYILFLLTYCVCICVHAPMCVRAYACEADSLHKSLVFT